MSKKVKSAVALVIAFIMILGDFPIIVKANGVSHSFEVELFSVNNESLASFTDSQTSIEIPDDNAILKINAENVESVYQYQFVGLNESNEEHVLQDYSENNIYNMSGLNVGTNVFRLNVKCDEELVFTREVTVIVEDLKKDSETNAEPVNRESEYDGNDNNVIQEENTYQNQILEKSSSIDITLISSKTQKEYVDRSVVLTANVENGSGNYQYQFIETYNSTDNVVREYSNECTYSFTTTGIGTHTYTVNAKDGNGQVIQASYEMTVVAHPDYKLSGTLTSNKTTKEYENRTVTFTTAVTKG
ncbi:hypothetical protein, partial [Faecalicatena contorta]|uniref:hypothetical protein n=1 Tax=Faecalicatena contorta TaxID=39482 RepID=UPI001F1DA87D